MCELLCEFSNGHICACREGLGYFHLDGANLQMQTRLVSKMMHQNLAKILWQFYYGKNSFIVLDDQDVASFELKWYFRFDPTPIYTWVPPNPPQV